MAHIQNVYSGQVFEINVGDKVDFKVDIEGSGTVVEILTDRNWLGDLNYTFVVDAPYHSQARHFRGHPFPVVLVDSDHIWPA